MMGRYAAVVVGGRADLFTLGWLSVFLLPPFGPRVPSHRFLRFCAACLGHEQFADHGDLRAIAMQTHCVRGVL